MASTGTQMTESRIPQSHITQKHRHSDYLSRRRAESREYWLIFCVAYVPMLLTTILERIAGRRPGSADAAPKRSVFAEAKAATAACIPFAFM